MKKEIKNRKMKISFYNALEGIVTTFKTERNFKIHVFFACLALAFAVYLKFSPVEMAIIIVVIIFVLVCELVNTAIEEIVDMIVDIYHPIAKKIKDIAAAAVLLAAFGAVLTGILLYTDKIINLFK